MMFNHPGPLAPLCITAAFLTPPAWAFWFLVVGCAIVAFVALKTFGLYH